MLPLIDSLANCIQQMHLISIGKHEAEALAGPIFGASLFPYLAFIYFLNVKENQFPKGVTVGFATCLVFVLATIPAAVAAKTLYGVSISDCDWLHGFAESMLVIHNLVIVIAFRQVIRATVKKLPRPASAECYAPMVRLVAVLSTVAFSIVLTHVMMGSKVHTPYLGGVMDLPSHLSKILSAGQNAEPENALSVATWILHIASLIEYPIVMGYVWQWASIVNNPKWKGLTWGLLPLQSSGITACAAHLLYNRVPIMVPLQAVQTCIGSVTAAIAALRIARSNGWAPSFSLGLKSRTKLEDDMTAQVITTRTKEPKETKQSSIQGQGLLLVEDDASFFLKLLGISVLASYAIKYGEVFFEFPFKAELYVGISLVAVPTMLNAFHWYKQSQDPSFNGWLL